MGERASSGESASQGYRIQWDWVITGSANATLNTQHSTLNSERNAKKRPDLTRNSPPFHFDVER
jgi:hypothetical protein